MDAITSATPSSNPHTLAFVAGTVTAAIDASLPGAAVHSATPIIFLPPTIANTVPLIMNVFTTPPAPVATMCGCGRGHGHGDSSAHGHDHNNSGEDASRGQGGHQNGSKNYNKSTHQNC